MWTKPGATTKQKTEHRVPLSAAAVQLLTEMREQAADNAEWVFPARGGGHRPHINEAWIRLRKAADIPDVHLHDLRHTYASIAVSSGLSLPVIGALLGHATPVTTIATAICSTMCNARRPSVSVPSLPVRHRARFCRSRAAGREAQAHR